MGVKSIFWNNKKNRVIYFKFSRFIHKRFSKYLKLTKNTVMSP